MSTFDEFFRDLDRAWSSSSTSKVRLRIIGSAALMLQTGYERGTKDGDVLESQELSVDVRHSLLATAGRGSKLHEVHRVYVDLVPNGLPFLPHVPLWLSLDELNSSLQNFEIFVLSVVDVVVSKLKRFNSNDASDIDAMVERDLVPHDELLARFRAAVDEFAFDARAEDLPSYVSNLNRIERDAFGLDTGTAIELPSWVGR